jgi:antitoxin (DNA-binding transcriptional repressor) of toxin-antitoxin stability system
VRAVGLKVLKNKLSEYVRLAASGEVVLVTDRDRVVAEIGPPREGRAEWLADAQLAGMVREGVLRPPLLPRGTVPARKPVCPTEELLGELDRDRGDR